ncbi:hypothetical protein [Marinobacter caseinilyticus]|uniref:hypothetical protein n=1 Tax=Marinobacter caseinilyticus TaxID=2692195 RepID=UPI00140E4FF7|nr:hypothetical protein [Marinobacter caseinilyticus]
MTTRDLYIATLAPGRAVPTLLCGHCNSILSRTRMFRNDNQDRYDVGCQTIALCSADDCGAVNSCDAAIAALDSPDEMKEIAS